MRRVRTTGAPSAMWECDVPSISPRRALASTAPRRLWVRKRERDGAVGPRPPPPPSLLFLPPSSFHPRADRRDRPDRAEKGLLHRRPVRSPSYGDRMGGPSSRALHMLVPLYSWTVREATSSPSQSTRSSRAPASSTWLPMRSRASAAIVLFALVCLVGAIPVTVPPPGVAVVSGLSGDSVGDEWTCRLPRRSFPPDLDSVNNAIAVAGRQSCQRPTTMKSFLIRFLPFLRLPGVRAPSSERCRTYVCTVLSTCVSVQDGSLQPFERLGGLVLRPVVKLLAEASVRRAIRPCLRSHKPVDVIRNSRSIQVRCWPGSPLGSAVLVNLCPQSIVAIPETRHIDALTGNVCR